MLRLAHSRLPLLHKNAVTIVERTMRYFENSFHSHGELELVYIKKGKGKRIVGTQVEPFCEGELVFVGSNVPHVWLSHSIDNEAPECVQSLVLYFDKKVLGEAFYATPAAQKINEIFLAAAGGIFIEKATKQFIVEKMEEALGKDDLHKIIVLLEILKKLCGSHEWRLLSSAPMSITHTAFETDRLEQVYHFIEKNYYKDISLKQVAEIANYSPQYFCRIFKQKTQRHFIEFLNEIRISNACKMLLSTDWTISEIAYKCGYKSVPAFNKLFKDLKGTTPSGYRLKTA